MNFTLGNKPNINDANLTFLDSLVIAIAELLKFEFKNIKFFVSLWIDKNDLQSEIQNDIIQFIWIIDSKWYRAEKWIFCEILSLNKKTSSYHVNVKS